jgi:hypothetical protein
MAALNVTNSDTSFAMISASTRIAVPICDLVGQQA